MPNCRTAKDIKPSNVQVVSQAELWFSRHSGPIGIDEAAFIPVIQEARQLLREVDDAAMHIYTLENERDQAIQELHECKEALKSLGGPSVGLSFGIPKGDTVTMGITAPDGAHITISSTGTVSVSDFTFGSKAT